PSTRPRGHAVTLGNIGSLLRLIKRLYGPKHLWITEYAYQTNPPDRGFGVSPAKQARYLREAFAIARRNPRIDMMLWFLLRDEPNISGGWQSGFYDIHGRRKPSYNAFRAEGLAAARPRRRTSSRARRRPSAPRPSSSPRSLI